jgi:hypothetical protein
MSYIIFIVIFAIGSAQKCPSSDPLCISCSDEKCNVCINSFITVTGECQKPLTKIENCLNYYNNEKCAYCKHGYFLNDKNQCQKIVLENCLEIDLEGKCTLCKKGIMTSAEGKCDQKCKNLFCDYCTSENSQERCIICQNGYVLKLEGNVNICVEESLKLKNCLYELNSEKCAICDMGYYYSNGECIRSEELELMEGVKKLNLVVLLSILTLF